MPTKNNKPSAKTKKTKTLIVILDSEDDASLNKMATAARLSRSAMVRELIRNASK